MLTLCSLFLYFYIISGVPTYDYIYQNMIPLYCNCRPYISTIGFTQTTNLTELIIKQTKIKLNLFNFRLKLRCDKGYQAWSYHLRLSTTFSVLSYILLTYNTVIYLQITCVLITYYHNVRNKRQQSTRLEMQKWL